MTIPLILENWSDKSNGSEAVVINWFVRIGQPVNQQQLLAEVMVEKTNLEVLAPQAGFIQNILATEGTIVTPGEVLGILEESAVPITVEPVTYNGSKPLLIPAAASNPPKLYVAASPAARALAKRLQLDLWKVARTLPPGTRLNEAAVREYMEIYSSRDSVEENGPIPARIERQSNLRRLIRSRVSRSAQQAAAVTLTTRADVSLLLSWLATQSKNSTTSPNLLTAIVRATALALQEHPLLNSSLSGDEVIFFLERNIGLVLPVPDGVAVPVVRRADKLSLAELATTIQQLEETTQQGRLRLRDTQPGTFTISDLSKYGIDSFNPILNLEQTACLGIGRVKSEPIWPDQPGMQVSTLPQIHQFVELNFTFDHRIADGPTSSACLQTIVTYLQNPSSLA